MRKCCICKQELPVDYIYDCPLHGLNCKNPICATCKKKNK